MVSKRFAGVCFCVLTMVGCGSIPVELDEPFNGVEAPADGQAVVYFYRTPIFFGQGITPVFEISNGQTVLIGNGGYKRVELSPGTYTATLQPTQDTRGYRIPDTALEFDVQEDQVGFIEVLVKIESMDANNPRAGVFLGVQDEAEALSEDEIWKTRSILTDSPPQ